MAENDYLEKELSETNGQLEKAKHDVAATCTRIASMKFGGSRFRYAIESLKEEVARLTFLEMRSGRLARLIESFGGPDPEGPDPFRYYKYDDPEIFVPNE